MRALAAERGLPVATKKDSQGLCFVGTINIKDFLKEYINEERGDVLNERGERIGSHDGSLFYTIGERHGFQIEISSSHSTPHYVIAKDKEKNTITVSENKPEILAEKSFFLESIGFVSEHIPETFEASARARYRAQLVPVTVQKEREKWQVTVREGDIAPASGQSLVFYTNGECLGGGVIA